MKRIVIPVSNKLHKLMKNKADSTKKSMSSSVRKILNKAYGIKQHKQTSLFGSKSAYKTSNDKLTNYLKENNISSDEALNIVEQHMREREHNIKMGKLMNHKHEANLKGLFNAVNYYYIHVWYPNYSGKHIKCNVSAFCRKKHISRRSFYRCLHNYITTGRFSNSNK